MGEGRLRQITNLGQSVWIDDLSRDLLDSGDLQRLVEIDGVTGVMSHPTTFQRAISESDRYDAHLRRAAAEVNDPLEVFLRVAYDDIRDAADVLAEVFGRSGGRDGYVSFELPPELAYNVEGSIAEARQIRQEIDRENVMIKVPATPEGVRAFEELTAQGQSINVTLLFAAERCEQIAEAYLRGLERRLDDLERVDDIDSVASFFVAGVDTKIDAALDEAGSPELKGRAGVASAKIAYECFRRMFSGDRWQALAARGANVQRLLWASTPVKSHDHPDMLYVEELIGSGTVTAMSSATLAAARDHAVVATTTANRDVQDARRVMAAIEDAGVNVSDIVCRQLVGEGVDAFAESFDGAVEAVGERLTALAAAEH